VVKFTHEIEDDGGRWKMESGSESDSLKKRGATGGANSKPKSLSKTGRGLFLLPVGGRRGLSYKRVRNRRGLPDFVEKTKSVSQIIILT